MKIIEKYFATQKQAEKYQQKLYSLYDFVKCSHAPLFSECKIEQHENTSYI